MKELLENLWDEYFWGKCAVIDTDEEKRLVKKAFFKGCEFAILFLLEAGDSDK